MTDEKTPSALQATEEPRAATPTDPPTDSGANPLPAVVSFLGWLARYYLFALVVLLVHVGALLAALYIQRSRHVPATPTPHRARSSAQTLTRIYAGDGRLVGEFAAEWRRWVPYKDIPPKLVKAFIAVEDKRFYQHRGIDWFGMFRAAWINLRTGSIVQGGSTITQQLAKTYIGTQRTVDRKIREAILASRLEATLTKSEIMEMYLNRIFLGHGAYGVSAAARRYFDKRLDELTLPEMALIAGLARAPSRYNPFLRPKRAFKRRNVVLHSMRDAGFITRDQHAAAIRQGDRGQAEPDLGLRRRPNFHYRETPYFTEWVRQLVIDRFGSDRLIKGGLRVETTVDTQVQAIARTSVDDLTRWVDKRQGWRGPVAHLADEADRAKFRHESKEFYGTKAPSAGQRYLGLVERVAEKGAVVSVAGRRYTVPLRYLRWGARFYTRSAVNDRFVSHAWLVLIPGDVVWVRRPLKRYDPLIPGSDAGPSVTSSHYFPPQVHLHDAKAARKVPPIKAPRGQGWPGPPYLALEQTPRVQGSLFAWDLRTGYVKAMVGGTDYDRSNFNRVTQACRQPGSTYKPVYYSLALDKGYKFSQLLKDRPHKIVDPVTGKIWYTYDYDHPEFRERFGSVLKGYTKRLDEALVWSKNTASISLFLKLGAKAVKRWAQRLGFTTEIIADEALALGASCTRTDELSEVFGVFANGGRRVSPVYIRRIIDRHGRILLDNTVPQDPLLPPADRFDRLYAWAGRQPPQVISPKTAHLTSTLMRWVITKGHGEMVRITKIPAAGKTGTASRTADTWFVGWTSRWMAASWLGDDHYVRELGRHDASYSTALPMWARFIYDSARFHPLREIPWLDQNGQPLNLPAVVPGKLPGIHRPDFQPPHKKKSDKDEKRPGA